MIKTNELMIGNWVLYEDKPIEVASITDNSICFFENKIGVRKVILCKPNEIDPIPITEKLLVKCGFDKHENWHSNDEKYFTNIEDDEIMYYEDVDSYLLVGSGVYVNFLHELQNAYFMLTKKQLEVKL